MKKKFILIFLLIVSIVSIGSVGIYIMNQEKPKQAVVFEETVIVKQGSIGKKTVVTLEYLIDSYLEDKNINKNKIAIYVHNFETNETYSLNSNKEFIAASTYKLPLAMYFYEMVANNEISLNKMLTSAARDYEPGGATYNLPLGGQLSVETLLHRSIQDSDNTASKMLYRYLGGWVDYKKKIAKYTTHDLSQSYYTRLNMQTAQYLSDCLDYIYDHQDIYQTLIKDMRKAQPKNYLNSKINEIAVQKYGYFESVRNSAGIVFEGSPYSIVVLTEMGDYGESVMGEINRICYEYYNAERKWDISVTW